VVLKHKIMETILIVDNLKINLWKKRLMGIFVVHIENFDLLKGRSHV